MTTKNGKPKGTHPPDEAGASGPVLDNRNAETAMQTIKDNGSAGETGKAVIGRDIQGHLGQKLKASYDDLVRQPVPDKFRQLLEELERREKKK